MYCPGQLDAVRTNDHIPDTHHGLGVPTWQGPLFEQATCHLKLGERILRDVTAGTLDNDGG